MSRRLRHESHRRALWERRHAPQVTELNSWIESLGDAHLGTPPLLAPHYHPRHATVVVLTGQPPTGAVGHGGSGMLSHENDDEASAQMEWLLRSVGLNPDLCIPWCAHPWPCEEDPSDDHLMMGARLFGELVDRLPALRVVVAFGGRAQQCLGWALRERPDLLQGRGIVHERTYQVLPAGDDRLEREAGIRATLERVAAATRSPRGPAPTYGPDTWTRRSA